jgi:sugar phosphate isomerase/epimerase
MLQLGILTGYCPYTLAEVIHRIKGHGFTTVQLDLDFRDMDLSTGSLDANVAARIRNTFRSADLPSCCISGYTNLVHPDPAIRKANLERLKKILALARDFGTPHLTCGLFTSSGWIEGDWR